MNATRAATIRLRSSFDGAVSLGRVQTPTLAILARREQEIRDFKPEPYWVVDAAFDTVKDAPPQVRGALPRGRQPPDQDRRGGRRGRRRLRGPDRRDHQARQERAQGARAAPLRPDLAAARRQQPVRVLGAPHAGAAQRLYEEHKALTYPRTNSRFITGDMIGEIKPIARLVGDQPEYAQASRVRARARRAAARPRGQRRQGHRPPRDHPHPRRPPPGRQDGSADDRRIYDLVVRRFLAVFHPDAVFENTRVETTVASHVFRTRGKVMLVPGWRGVYGEIADADGAPADDDEGREQQLPQARAGRAGRGRGGRLRGQGDQAAAALHRGLAAGGDGDRGQAGRRGGAARGDEGLRDRHPGDPRGDHRAPASRSATSSATAARWSSPRRA